MATVRIANLQCEVKYTIIAEGRDGGTGELIGPRSSHGAITTGPCPVTITTILPTTILAGTSTTGTTYVCTYVATLNIILLYIKYA